MRRQSSFYPTTIPHIKHEESVKGRKGIVYSITGRSDPKNLGTTRKGDPIPITGTTPKDNIRFSSQKMDSNGALPSSGPTPAAASDHPETSTSPSKAIDVSHVTSLTTTPAAVTSEKQQPKQPSPPDEGDEAPDIKSQLLRDGIEVLEVEDGPNTYCSSNYSLSSNTTVV